MIFAVIHPFCLSGGVDSELGAVEIAHEILSSGTTERSTGIDVAEEHPFALVGAFNREINQVGTFPHTTVATLTGAETALIRPIFEVGRGEELHFLSHSEAHNPFLGSSVPDHFRVAEITSLRSENGVGGIFHKRHSIVGTVSHALSLALISRGVERHDSILAKTGTIFLIDHSRAAENSTHTIAKHSHRLMFPVHEVGRSCVSPTHIPPHCTKWVVLIVEVINAIFPEHTIGVVHPAIGRSEMVGRAVFFALRSERIGASDVFHPDSIAAICVVERLSVVGVVRHMNVESIALVDRIGDEIVHFILGEAHIHSIHNVVVVDHADARLR